MKLLCSFVPQPFTKHCLEKGKKEKDEYACFIGLLFFYSGPLFLPFSSQKTSCSGCQVTDTVFIVHGL